MKHRKQGSKNLRHSYDYLGSSIAHNAFGFLLRRYGGLAFELLGFIRQPNRSRKPFVKCRYGQILDTKH